MIDRELLERAAKAAGVKALPHLQDPHVAGLRIFGGYWNPLTDDGDAFRLAVALRLPIEFWTAMDQVAVTKPNIAQQVEPTAPDPCAATRRAIVRAAASLA